MEENKKTKENFKNKKPLFEMVDMGYIAVEFGFLLMLIFTISAFLYADGSFVNMNLFVKITTPIMVIRALWIFYKAFILKKYHLKFYEDGIYRVEIDKFLPLENIKKGNDVFWALASEKANYWDTSKIFVIVIMFIPLFIFTSLILVAKWISTIVYKKNLFANQYSLIVTFDDDTKKEKEQIINIPYGYLKKEELEFIKNYFSPYFNIDNVEKSFLNLPEKPEIDEGENHGNSNSVL
jgi:hypothetical protein